jgi:hypothetical protein
MMEFLIQLEDRRNVGENSCNSEDGTGQRVQSLMLMMMIMMMMIMLMMMMEFLSALFSILIQTCPSAVCI